jgi:hypothetical protein
MRFWAVERWMVGELFDAILAPRTNLRLPLGAVDAGVVAFFEQHLTSLPTRTRWALRVAVDALAALTPLHPRGAHAALEQLADSRIYVLREAVTLLKSVVCLGYFAHPQVRRELGLDLTLTTLPGPS